MSPSNTPSGTKLAGSRQSVEEQSSGQEAQIPLQKVATPLAVTLALFVLALVVNFVVGVDADATHYGAKAWHHLGWVAFVMFAAAFLWTIVTAVRFRSPEERLRQRQQHQQVASPRQGLEPEREA